VATKIWIQLTRSVSLIILRSTLKCGQIYADPGDLVDTALGLPRQNGLSPTVGVQLAHKELITKLRRLDFWVISSQDRSYHNQTNADNLALTTNVPQGDAPYIGLIDNSRQRSMSDPAPRTAAPLHNASMWTYNQCRLPANGLERRHLSSYEHAAQEEKRRHNLIVQENEKDDQRLPEETNNSCQLPRLGQSSQHQSSTYGKTLRRRGNKRRPSAESSEMIPEHMRESPRVGMEMLQSTPSLSPAAEPYLIRSTGKGTFSVQTVSRGMPKWQQLESIPSVHVDRNLYSVDDVVYILLQGEQDDSIARVRQIRDLSDGRKVICVLWYYSRRKVRRLKCSNPGSWSERSRYMLSTQMQILMWDTINGKVETEVQDELAEGKVIDVCDKPCRIYDQDHCSVEWVRKRMT
jgi:hypothetical protein